MGAVIVMLTLCVIAASPLWGQGRGPRQAGAAAQTARDPLAFLKQAMSKAGAAALDSTQEGALNTAITNFRSANAPGTPDPAVQSAREAYSNAIFAGDTASATTAADNLANLLSARQRTMLEAEASFHILALSNLHSDQVAALRNSIGNNGILRALQSLVGPGPGFGRGTMGAPRNDGRQEGPGFAFQSLVIEQVPDGVGPGRWPGPTPSLELAGTPN